MGSSPDVEHKVEALAEATADANQLDETLKREVARIVVELHGNPHRGELTGVVYGVSPPIVSPIDQSS